MSGLFPESEQQLSKYIIWPNAIHIKTLRFGIDNDAFLKITKIEVVVCRRKIRPFLYRKFDKKS